MMIFFRPDTFTFLRVGSTLSLGFFPIILFASFQQVIGEEKKLSFSRDIRPILTDTCFNCHGADEGSRKADLRLDQAASAYEDRDGYRAIVPGDPEESEMIYRILTDEEDEVMPPSDHPHQLTAEQKETLRQWIRQGAEFDSHWAFEPVTAPSFPGNVHPIDHFVRKKLEPAGLEPQPRASRETLIRRLSFDLTGLPPDPGAVTAFVDDDSPDAYGKAVDRLLASPAYGERMAMWWLDGARYADSHGFQADWERYQWPWRDWVINAFNDNMPFDQFSIEQLAGDLLPDATKSQIVATGFNRNHRINTEGGALDEEWLIENVIDRVETTGSVWLGLTFNCCRCHDHKYDPISQKEFFEFFAFFNNLPEKGKGPGKAGNFEPVIRIDCPEHDAEVADLKRQITEFQARQSDDDSGDTQWTVIEKPEVKSEGGTIFETLPDQSLRATGPDPANDTRRITFTTGPEPITGIRLEALSDPSFSNRGFARGHNGNFVLTSFTCEIIGRDGKLYPRKFSEAVASYEQKGYPVKNAIDTNGRSGWAVNGNTRKENNIAIFQFEKPQEILSGQTVQLTLKSDAFEHHHIDRLRISITHDEGPSLPGQKVDPKLVALERKLKDTEAKAPTVMVMEEMDQPRPAFILERGEYDKPTEQVFPNTPAFLPPLDVEDPPSADHQPNRLDLARWLMAPENPLTARVQVNRLWENLFGIGLVATSENFGVQADYPSHPELLDHLAHRFVESGWDLKELIKYIVTSETYRQLSHTDSWRREKDPNNRLLSRGPRFRLQAEMIRDQALALSGLLGSELGGPSVRPYQPPGIWSETNFYGNLRNYQHDTDGNQYRRSLYTIWKRTAAPPAMTLFDMPNREICTVTRPRTNTPLQALGLLNDPTYLEAARVLAERVMENSDSPSEQIANAFRRATARPITDRELEVLEAGYHRRLERYRADPEAATAVLTPGESQAGSDFPVPELAALTTTTSIILNLDEVINKN